MNKQLCVLKITEQAFIPHKITRYSAGYDLFTYYDFNIKPFQRIIIHLGIKITLPHGYYGRIAPKSGLAINKGIDVLGGCCDSDYRGEICVVLFNLSDTIQYFNKGSPIAQLIIEKIYEYENVFTIVDNLDTTTRGEHGFGSLDEQNYGRLKEIINRENES